MKPRAWLLLGATGLVGGTYLWLRYKAATPSQERADVVAVAQNLPGADAGVVPFDTPDVAAALDAASPPTQYSTYMGF